jgi:response regulator NasT
MSTALRISVADDEADMREYYQRMLTHLGHHVVSCSANGRDLVADCLRQLPDLVITDIKMPELDGLHAAEQIGQQFPVPVILVSAHHSPEMVERANAACVQAFLTKPIKLTDLAPTIDRARRQFERLHDLRLEEIEMREARQHRRDNSEQRCHSDSLEQGAAS